MRETLCARRWLVAVLVVFLGVVSAHPAFGDLSLTLSTQKGSFQEGETLTVFAAAQNSGGDDTVDVYLVLLDPAGGLSSLGPAGWQAGLAPWLSGLVLPAAFNLPAVPLFSAALPAASPPIARGGEHTFMAAFTDANLQLKSPISAVSFRYIDAAYLVGSWKGTPHYINDPAGSITYSFALYNGEQRFTMGGRVWGVGIQLVFGRYALESGGRLTYTLESECLQYPEGGWYLCEDPFIRAFPVPEITTTPYAIDTLPGLGFEILKTNIDRGSAEQGWYARIPEYSPDASATGQLVGVWRCLVCLFPSTYQLIIYRSGGGYRFHWIEDVADPFQGFYNGLSYYAGSAQVIGNTLSLSFDTGYQCPNTVFQYATETFLVEPGLLAGCPAQPLTGIQWDIPFMTQPNGDGTTALNLTLTGGVLPLTRAAN